MIKYQKKSGHFTSFDGTEIYYEVRGQGRPLLFLYGIGCLTNHWRHQLDYFSLTHQTIVLDYRGHHNSAIPTDPAQITIEAIAKDVSELLNYLKIKRIDVISHSYGGLVITELYKLIPQKFRSACFINPFLKNPFEEKISKEQLLNVLQLAETASNLTPDYARMFWKLLFNNPLAVPVSGLLGGFNLQRTSLRDVEIYTKGIGSMELSVFLPLFQEMISLDERETFKKIDCPVLIIGGDKDSLTKKHHQEEMKHLSKNSDLLIVPYGSHCTQLDFPEFVNLKLEKFILQS